MSLSDSAASRKRASKDKNEKKISQIKFPIRLIYQAGMIENHRTKIKKMNVRKSDKGPLATKTGKMEQQGLGVTSPQTTSQGWAPVVPG